MDNKNLQNSPSSLQPPMFTQKNDELDLRELFMVLWKGKLIIVACTLLLTSGAVVFALSQPNVYQSSAVLKMVYDPYGFVTERGYQTSAGNTSAAGNKALADMKHSLFVRKINQLAGAESSTLESVIKSWDRRSGNITLSKLGGTPAEAYDDVKLYSSNVNQAYKQFKLTRLLPRMKITKELLAQSKLDKVQESFATKYAQQVYQKSWLELPTSELVTITQQPVEPQVHIKPKRALIVVLGTLLGGMLGVAIVLVRFSFKREYKV